MSPLMLPVQTWLMVRKAHEEVGESLWMRVPASPVFGTTLGITIEALR